MLSCTIGALSNGLSSKQSIPIQRFALIPDSKTAFARDSPKKYISEKEVTPLRSISAMPSNEPEKAQSLFNLSSKGKIFSESQRSRGKSAPTLRSNVIGT